MSISAASPKCAVVGSGPAGLGALTALIESGSSPRVTLFEINRPLRRPEFAREPANDLVEAYYDEVYRKIWRSQPRTFPPPKTNFSETLPKYEVGGKRRIFRSDTLGGLSNFWGGTSLPFTQREFATRPVDRAAMDPHYRRMADMAGIAGKRDALNRYFGEDYVNRPPMHLTRVFEKMEQTVNAAQVCGEFEVVAGANRCMIETRPDEPNSCVRCGECITGCFRDSIFSARPEITRMVSEGIVELVKGKVRAFDPKTRTLIVAIEGEGNRDFGPFDRIYLAAGCPNTTEIALRSLGLTDAGEMADNAVYVFPILYFGRTDAPRREPYLSLSNLLIGLLPRETDLPFAQVQIYTNFDYMWRYNVPPALWPLARGAISWSRNRLFWARLYVAGSLSQAYSVRLQDDALQFSYARGADKNTVARIMPLLRGALNRGGFYVPSFPPWHQNANSHYSSTLPYGGSRAPVAENGEITPGVFLCDSTVFPDLPAVSLTFTIMANAHRIASQSL